MLVPYPANQVVDVVLVLCKPKFALFTNDIENLRDTSVWLQRTIAHSISTHLSSNVGQIRVSSFFPGSIDIEFVNTGSEEDHIEAW